MGQTSATKVAKSVIRKGSRVTGSGLSRLIAKGLHSEEPRSERNKLFCGDASYCPRRAVLFSTTGGVNITDAAGHFYMGIGTTVHELIQKGLSKSGVLIEAERRISLKHLGVEVSGRIDGVIRLDGQARILEIKTCGALPGKPKKEHLHQAILYALISGIHRVIILYMSRSIADWQGALQMVEFEVEVTPDDLKMISDQLASSIVGTSMKIIPEIPSHITSAHDCGFCPFQERCWNPSRQPAKVNKAFKIKCAEVSNELISSADVSHKGHLKEFKSMLVKELGY